jgi:cell division inhibitor SepF
VNKILTKLKDFVGITEQEEEEYTEYEEEETWNRPAAVHQEEESASARENENSSYRRHRSSLPINSETPIGASRNNVIGMPGITNGLAEVVVIEPHSFEEMPQVIQTLRERKSVVLNLNVMEPEEAQRAVDFVAGGTYAIDGHQERIGESIFLFTPNCVKVSTLMGTVNEMTEASKGMQRPTMTNSTWGLDSRIAQ